MFENPRRGRQARNFTENDPKILDLKSPSEQIIFRKLSLGAPDSWCMDQTGLSSTAFVSQSKSTELCSSAAVVPQSKSTET